MEDYASLLERSLPLIMRGAMTTLQVFGAASCFSLIFGTAFGVLLSQRLRIPVVSAAIEILTFILRGTPFYVQLLIVYFVLPEVAGWNFSPFTASVISLGFCSAGYVAQIVRGSLNGVPAAQWEGAFSLGYSMPQSLRIVIFPQMARLALPSLGNELDALLKSTSVVSTIGMLELTRMGMNLVSREMEPAALYATVAAVYLLMSAVLNGLLKYGERRLCYVKS